MAARRSVLVVGGGGKAPPADGAALPESIKSKVSSPADLKQTLDSMIKDAADKGFDVRMMQLSDLDNGASAWLSDVSDTLESKRWDGFMIGNGIRGTPSLTLVFEQLVKIGRDKAPHARMGFNTHPLDVVETMQRMFAE